MVLRRLGEKIVSLFTGKTCIGKDSFGNKYFIKYEKGLEGETIVKRLVEYPTGGAFQYDPTKVSPEWHQWLSSTRDEPPEEHATTHVERNEKGADREVMDIRKNDTRKRSVKTPVGSIEI